MPVIEGEGQPSTDATSQALPLELEATGLEDVTLTWDTYTLDAATLVNSPLLPYLAMIAGLIEGRAISREELLRALLRSMRQRSFDRLSRREYVLRLLKQHPR
jgi:hypothetical protein